VGRVVSRPIVIACAVPKAELCNFYSDLVIGNLEAPAIVLSETQLVQAGMLLWNAAFVCNNGDKTKLVKRTQIESAASGAVANSQKANSMDSDRYARKVERECSFSRVDSDDVERTKQSIGSNRFWSTVLEISISPWDPLS
jgi:hypothetical protein